jgi:hypothetical protein
MIGAVASEALVQLSRKFREGIGHKDFFLKEKGHKDYQE